MPVHQRWSVADAIEIHSGRETPFHEQAWQGVKGRDWRLFVRSWPREDLDRLVQLLRNTDEALGGVADACRAASAALAGLRQRAEQKQGLHSRQ